MNTVTLAHRTRALTRFATLQFAQDVNWRIAPPENQSDRQANSAGGPDRVPNAQPAAATFAAIFNARFIQNVPLN